jgi:hypothetical protein
MFAHTFMVTLASFMLSTASQSPSWQTDYTTARTLGSKGHKPLAVFIGSGKNGWNHVSQEGELGLEVKRLLAKDYICVYIDTNFQAGKQLASEFEIPKGTGLVVSDHTGKYQAFHHPGDLPTEQLLQYLRRYADSKHVVRATESNQPQAVNYDPPANNPPAVYYQPVYGTISRGC